MIATVAAPEPDEPTPPGNGFVNSELINQDVIHQDLIRKADAGAALLYAIYHHPRAKELVSGDFWSTGLSKAYAQACTAYQVGAN